MAQKFRPTVEKYFLGENAAKITTPPTHDTRWMRDASLSRTSAARGGEPGMGLRRPQLCRTMRDMSGSPSEPFFGTRQPCHHEYRGHALFGRLTSQLSSSRVLSGEDAPLHGAAEEVGYFLFVFSILLFVFDR